MSGLFGNLTQGVQALNAQSRAVETAGRNLANVNNPAYSRQRVLFGDRGTVLTPQGAQSLGIEAKSVQQIRDVLLDRQLVREISTSATLSAQQGAYEKGQAALGETIDRLADPSGTTNGQGLAEAMGEFFNAFSGWAARPTDVGQRQLLLARSSILTERFQTTDGRLAQIQTDLDAALHTDAAEINRLLTSITDLNAQVGRFEINAEGSAVDLRDQRQAQVELLAGKLAVDSRPAPGAPGQIEVFTRGPGGTQVVLVAVATPPPTVSFNGTQLLAGTTVLDPAGGSTHGLLTARDGPLQTLRDDLDRLAAQLVTSVNAAYAPTGDTFFAAGGTTAATIALRPGLTPAALRASASGIAGDNTVATAVAALASQPFTRAGGDHIDGTFAQAYAGMVSELGQAVATATARHTDQSNVETLVRQQRDSVSAVSLDEELTDLTKAQRAFQASSRVISVVDELLETIINRMGR